MVISTKLPRRGELVAIEPLWETPSHIIASANGEIVQYRRRGTHGRDTLEAVSSTHFLERFDWHTDYQLTGAWLPAPAEPDRG